MGARDDRARSEGGRWRAVQGACALVGAALVPANLGVWVLTADPRVGLSPWFVGLAIAQTACGLVACLVPLAIRPRSGWVIAMTVLGALVAAGGPLGLWLAWAWDHVTWRQPG